MLTIRASWRGWRLRREASLPPRSGHSFHVSPLGPPWLPALTARWAGGSGSHSGSGMNSTASPGTFGNAPRFHSSLARSIRSFELETKFQKMWREPSSGAPPRSMTREAPRARRAAFAPAPEDEHRPRSVRGALAPELALDDVRGALFVLVGERQLGAVVELGVHVEGGRANADRRARAVGVAREDPQARAGALDERERRARVVLELRAPSPLPRRAARPTTGCRARRRRFDVARRPFARSGRCRARRSSSSRPRERWPAAIRGCRGG